MTNKLPVVLAPLAAVVAGVLAYPRGSDGVGELQLSILVASMVTAPILAALLVDRGAFALAGYALGLKRRHQPSAAGPLLAVAAVVTALFSVSVHDFNLAVVGFAFISIAAVFCAASFVRSVAIDLRGQLAPQALRVAAVVCFVALAVAAR